MFKLPPSVQMILFLLVGLVIGAIGGYLYAIQKMETKMARNELEVIILDGKAEKESTKETAKIINKVRKEHEKDKDFKCSTAVLPNVRVQRLQREISTARRRSDSSLLTRAIERARNF